MTTWTGKVSIVDEYHPLDEVRVGDVVRLGEREREVVEVSRSAEDAVRTLSVKRLRCGYSRNGNGSTLSFCTGPVVLWRTELKNPRAPYGFHGIVRRASP